MLRVDLRGRKRAAGELFAKKLVERLGDRIARVMLYGSVVKGSCGIESDVDLFVVTLEDPGSVAREAGDIWAEVLKETGENVEPFFVSLWELEGLRGSFTEEVGKGGIVLHDGSGEVLSTEEARGYVELAEHYLERALRMYEGGDHRVSADLGYNALELALRAGVRLADKPLPRTHGGIIRLFGALYVVTGGLNREIASLFTQCFATRNRARYEPRALVSEGDARAVLDTAKKTIQWIRKKVPG